VSGEVFEEGAPSLRELLGDLSVGSPRKFHVIMQCATCHAVYHRTTVARLRTAEAFEESLHAQAWLEHVARRRCTGEESPSS
jgi:hypothetical protein